MLIEILNSSMENDVLDVNNSNGSTVTVTMFQERIFIFLLKYVYVFVSVFGLCPFLFDFEKKRFKTSPFMQLYSTFVVISFSYFYPTSGISVVSALNPLVAITFFYLSMTTICLTLLMQIKHCHKIVRFLNDAIDFLYNFNKFIDRHKVNYVSSIFAIIFKIIVVNLTAQYACIDGVNTILTQVTGKKDYFAILMVSVAYTLQSMILNIFYGSLLAVSFYLQQMNDKIDDIVVQAKWVSSVDGNKYMREKVYCELSDQLDEITTNHSRLIELTIRLNRLCSFQILLSITNFFGLLLIELFLAYLFVAEGLLTGQPIDVSFFLIVLIYAFSIFTELFLLAAGCTNVTRISDCIGYSLHRMFLTNVDGRLKQSIEKCSIQLLQYKLNITASNMFNVENSLTFSMVGSIFGYLLILIQFHLAKARTTKREGNVQLKSF